MWRTTFNGGDTGYGSQFQQALPIPSRRMNDARVEPLHDRQFLCAT